MKVIEIHEAIKSGKKVYWGNTAYQVLRSELRPEYRDYDLNHATYYDGHCLEIIYVSTWFGGYAEGSELNECFTE
jgi:hypothetical protein